MPYLGQSLEHDGDHCELCEAFGDDGQGFVVRHEPAITAEPGEGAFDHPASAYNLETAVLTGTLDDFQINRLMGKRCFELWPGITAIGENFGDKREQPPRPADEAGGTVPVLHTGRDHLDTEQQSDGIDERVTLDALGFLAGIVAGRIGIGPPFSVAFTA